MRTRIVLVASWVVLSAAATGCGGSGDAAGTGTSPDQEASTTQPEPATTAVPEPTTTAVAFDGADTYLALVAASNCATATYVGAEDKLTGSPASEEEAWALVQTELIPAAQNSSSAVISFYEGLVNANWPPDLQPNIDALVVELTTEAGWWQTLATASNLESFGTIRRERPEAQNNAGVVRAKLGLDSNVSDEVDYCAQVPPAA